MPLPLVPCPTGWYQISRDQRMACYFWHPFAEQPTSCWSRQLYGLQLDPKGGSWGWSGGRGSGEPQTSSEPGKWWDTASWVGNGLLLAPHKPPMLSYSGRITGCSAKAGDSHEWALPTWSSWRCPRSLGTVVEPFPKLHLLYLFLPKTKRLLFEIQYCHQCNSTVFHLPGQHVPLYWCTQAYLEQKKPRNPGI